MEKFTRVIAKEDIKTFDDAGIAQLGNLNRILDLLKGFYSIEYIADDTILPSGKYTVANYLSADNNTLALYNVPAEEGQTLILTLEPTSPAGLYYKLSPSGYLIGLTEGECALLIYINNSWRKLV